MTAPTLGTDLPRTSDSSPAPDVEARHRLATNGLMTIVLVGLLAETALRIGGLLAEPWTGVVFGGFVALGIGGSLLLGFTWPTPWTDHVRDDEDLVVLPDAHPTPTRTRDREPVAA